MRNQNIPVDEKRFQALREAKKSTYTRAMESDMPLMPVPEDSVQLLRLWLGWTRCMVDGKNPKDFLPTFGFEGRTPAEIRKDNISKAQAEAAADGELPDFSSDDSESEENEERPVVQAPAAPEEQAEEAPPEPVPFDGIDPRITWPARAMMGHWLAMARASLHAPQNQDWQGEQPRERLPRSTGASSIEPAVPPALQDEYFQRDSNDADSDYDSQGYS